MDEINASNRYQATGGHQEQIGLTPKLDQFLELIDKAPEAEGEEKTE